MDFSTIEVSFSNSRGAITLNRPEKLNPLIGPALTKELVMTCRPFGADEARAAGFLNRVVPAVELDATVEELVGQLEGKSALTLSATSGYAAASISSSRSFTAVPPR